MCFNNNSEMIKYKYLPTVIIIKITLYQFKKKHLKDKNMW